MFELWAGGEQKEKDKKMDTNLCVSLNALIWFFFEDVDL